jgi:hypothetical protein
VDGTGDLGLVVALRTEGAMEGVGDLGREGPGRDRTETVDGAGDFGRAVLRTEGATDGVGDFGREGPATALLDRAAGLLVACVAAILVGDFGLVVDRGRPDAAVRVVRTELTDAADDATGGRVINGRIGPLICLPCLVDGVGLVLSLALAAPIPTLGPSLAAVGLLALAVPGNGAVAGPETERADLALVKEAVEAELLNRSRLKPGGSAETGSGRNVDGREVVDCCVELEAVERTLAASDNDMTREVVRGIPGGPKRVRARGARADGPSNSFTPTSISGISSKHYALKMRRTIADFFQCPILKIMESSSITYLSPPSPDMRQDTLTCLLNLLS